MKFGLRIYIVFIVIILLYGNIINAQTATSSKDKSPEAEAIINYDAERVNTAKKQLKEGVSIPLSVFFDLNKKTAPALDKNEIRVFKTVSDIKGISHHRAKQYYNGIEIDNVQLLMHEEKGKVHHAHGNLISEMSADTHVYITEKQAWQYALKHIGPDTKLWKTLPPKYKSEENSVTENDGKLIFTSGRNEPYPKNFKLAYRFDVVTMKPLDRYYIDIDARTGELFNKVTLLNEGDVFTYGHSLNHDTVPIVVSDSDFPEWKDPANWHTSAWNAFENRGLSWWIADTSLGANGGYSNHWFEVLETPPVLLLGDDLKLRFHHRYSVEDPAEHEEYDGWDGMNVRISNDKGKTWQVLKNPNIPYTCNSLYSFGSEHGEGPNIPGWAGKLDAWTQVFFDLSEFKDDTVIIRFAFASDPAYSTLDGDSSLFGWQIDYIKISNRNANLFFDQGTNSQMIAKNLVSDAQFIEGNYRLREVGRGGGISTYNAFDIETFPASVDFVSDEMEFTQEPNRVGVEAHWAQEVTYDYFLNHHERKSYDDENGRLIAYVNWNFDENNNNAYWNGFASVYGAGDNSINNPFSDLDVVGHEISHGVTEYSAALIYENEPGALNESFSDIFGIAIEIENLGFNDESWQLGENVINPYIRSMKDPNSRSDPDTYKGSYWRRTTTDPTSSNDYGGVHTNSGVQNYWFYLLSAGGSGINDNDDTYSVTGIGIEDAARIAYRNLTLYLQPTSEYHDAASYSAQAAIDLFGENSFQHLSVIDAWYAVGIYFTPKINVRNYYEYTANIGESSERTIVIRNQGMEELTIENIELTGNYFHIDTKLNFPITIAPDDDFRLELSFDRCLK